MRVKLPLDPMTLSKEFHLVPQVGHDLFFGVSWFSLSECIFLAVDASLRLNSGHDQHKSAARSQTDEISSLKVATVVPQMRSRNTGRHQIEITRTYMVTLENPDPIYPVSAHG